MMIMRSDVARLAAHSYSDGAPADHEEQRTVLVHDHGARARWSAFVYDAGPHPATPVLRDAAPRKTAAGQREHFVVLGSQRQPAVAGHGQRDDFQEGERHA